MSEGRGGGTQAKGAAPAGNLKTLARMLGLSPTTVSRALNGYPEVGAGTRQRVLEAAERLHYRPNPTARRLATGRAQAIGIVFSVDHNILQSPIVADLLAGVSDTAAERGIDLLLTPVAAGQEAGAACRRLIAGGMVDALVLLSPIVDDPAARDLADLAFPVVAHGRPFFERNVASVSIDNRGGFRRACEHLIELGHRRIALINGDESRAYGRDRRLGMMEALAAAGLGLNPDHASAGPMTFQNGHAGARRMLALAQRPTAILCSSILIAAGVLKAAGEAGLAVPSALSVVAHDDEVAALPADLAGPALTVVHSSVRLAGRRLAQIALERARGVPVEALTQVWDVPLRIGATTAPPPAR